ncbi:hypothetical protein QOT17_002142 [Balamuthia mandrillaris]
MDQGIFNSYNPLSFIAITLSLMLSWNGDINNYLISLKNKGPITVCGDLNAYDDPRNNSNGNGKPNKNFSQFKERHNLQDAFLHFNDNLRTPTYEQYISTRKYTQRTRIDYFLTERIEKLISTKLGKTNISTDHKPITATINLQCTRPTIPKKRLLPY